jgi:elongator complex protein 1
MSSYQLALSPEFSRSLPVSKLTAPAYVTFSRENDDLAILWESGYFEIWTLNTRLVPGSAKILDPAKIGGFAQTEKESGIRWRQIFLRSNDTSGKLFTVTVLGTGPGDQSDTITVLTVENGVTTGTIDFPLPYRNCRLVTGSVPDICQSPDGELFTCKSLSVFFFCSQPVDLNQDTHQEIRTAAVARFSEFCVHAYKVELPQSEIDKPQAAYLGLAKSGKLYVSTSEEETRTMATNAISFTITPNFAIFTTNAHEAIFAPLSSLSRLFDQPNGSSKETPPEWIIRKVERGSRIVVAVPSSMSLVLQMPRGNLETINPRPLVMEVVKHDLDV